jgi:hypothetical protein
MDDASAKVIDLIFGRWRSQILYTGVKVGVFDALASGPKNAVQVAHELDVDAGMLYRLMRALGSLELLKCVPSTSSITGWCPALLWSSPTPGRLSMWCGVSGPFTHYWAEQGRGADGLQRPLVPRSRFPPQLTLSVRGAADKAVHLMR